MNLCDSQNKQIVYSCDFYACEGLFLKNLY